jgi:hypothetical protein
MIAEGVNANPNFWPIFEGNRPKMAEKSGKLEVF